MGGDLHGNIKFKKRAVTSIKERRTERVSPRCGNLKLEWNH